ncbi:integrase-like protein [Streptomyces sp. 846.5]|nr:integrase-like protein [Streptomyces sp. 846.5]
MATSIGPTTFAVNAASSSSRSSSVARTSCGAEPVVTMWSIPSFSRSAAAASVDSSQGEWYHAYVIIDIYSRYICGWTVERAESADRAEELIRETIERNGIVPETVHADRGTAMTSKKVSQLLIDLGVTRSHSRPKVSNDNPFSESNFKTMKYMSDFPKSFNSLEESRSWFDGFISYYNHEHRHSGIGLHTPASVHFGTAELVREQRATTLAEAYARHPERFARRPQPPKLPEQVWINEPQPETEPAQQTS